MWLSGRTHLKIAIGLIGVVSLPRAFVFRVNMDDPHPIPWVRVKLSCVIGQALYPHPQWARLASIWESLYPTTGLDVQKRSLLTQLEAGMPDFVKLLVNHCPKALHGRSLIEVMQVETRQPSRLVTYYERWRADPAQLYKAAPSLVFAVIGQAKLNGNISPEEESELLDKLLRHWALRRTLESSALCATMPVKQAAALVR